MAIATLGFKVDSKDAARASKDLDRLDKAAGTATIAARGLGKAVGIAGIAIAAAFSSGAIVRTIADFDSSMSRLGAVSRATAVDLAAMRDISKELGATTEFSATQAADGLNFLAMAGFSASEAMSSLPAVLDLATASGMGLAQSADIASNIMSGFGIAAENAANVSDVLAAASTRANTDVSQLGQAMSTVAPISAALGISLEDTAAAIGVLSDAGIQGSRAGTAMRGVLASLAGPTEQARDVLSQLGLTVQDVNPEINELSTVMGRLGDAGLSTADAITLFGREAASGALVLVEGSKRLGEFGDELGNVDGAANDMATTMRDNLRGDINGAISAAQGLIIALGDAGLTAVLRGVVQGITAVVRGLSGFIDGVKSAINVINNFAGSNVNTSIAIDNVTLAMGDEISQANALFTLMGNGNTMTQSLALSKLSEAEAHLRNADAIRQETQDMVNLQVAALELQRITASDALRSIAAPGTDLDQLPLRLRDAYEETEQSLAIIINDQASLNALAKSGSQEFTEAQAEVVRIREAISNAVDGMVVFDGKLVTANDLSERLANAANSVNFEGAIASAARLADVLNISLSAAASLANLQSSIDSGGGRGQDPRKFLEGGSLSANVSNVSSSQSRIQEQINTFNSARSRSGGSRSSGGGGISDAQKEHNDALREAETIINSLFTPQEEYNDALDQANRLLDAGVLPMEVYTQHVEQLKEELDNEVFAEQRQAIDEFSAALLQGEDGIKSYFKTLIAEAAQAMLSSGIQQLLGFAGGASSGGGLFGGVGKLFAGFFDSGGNIPSGQFGIAGENGPEIIKGPANVTSTRDTAAMLQGGGAQALNVTVSVMNDGNLQAYVTNQANQVVAQSAPGIISRSVAATSSQMQKTKAGF